MESVLSVEDYRNAPGGIGPQAAQWADKPHRLIYDLCREINRLRGIPVAPIRDFTIPVSVRTQDNGDGGYSIRAYNNDDDLIADHPLSRQWNSKTEKYEVMEISPELREDILNEEDPYENGYIDHSTIEINFLEGVARLSKPISFHAGQ